MEMLIAILLWIGCITPNNSYTYQAIDTYCFQQQAVVSNVMTTPPLQEYVWQNYSAAVPTVELINPYE